MRGQYLPVGAQEQKEGEVNVPVTAELGYGKYHEGFVRGGRAGFMGRGEASRDVDDQFGRCEECLGPMDKWGRIGKAVRDWSTFGRSYQMPWPHSQTQGEPTLENCGLG